METWLFCCAVMVEYYRIVTTLKGNYREPAYVQQMANYATGTRTCAVVTYLGPGFSISVLKVRVHASFTKTSKGLEFPMTLHSRAFKSLSLRVRVICTWSS